MQRKITLIVLTLLVLMGIFAVIQARHSGNLNLNTSQTSSPSPSTTPELTETYRNQELGFSFNYPAGWVVTDGTVGQTRQIQAVSPTNFTLLGTYGPAGVGGQCEQDPNTTVGREAISLLGQNFTIFWAGDKNQNQVTTAYLLNRDTPCNNIPFIRVPTLPGQPENLVRIEMFYGNRQPTPVNEFTGSDYQTAKRILESVRMGS